MMSQLPALLVLLPLIAGVLCLLLPGRLLPWLLAQITTVGVLAVAVGLLYRVLDEGTVTYAFGNWPEQWGIGYRIDSLNIFVILIVAVVGCVATLYARRSVEAEIPNDRLNLFYGIWLLAILGLLGIAVTGDVFNVYVLIEVSSLTLYALIAMGKGRDRRALTASLRYLIVGSIGASFILLGIGYLLMVTGTLNLVDMAQRLAALSEPERNRTVVVAFTFLLVGMSVKMALWPLHMWLPNAYGAAPSAVSALVAATATKVGVYMAIRFLFTLFGPDFTFAAISTEVGDFTFTCSGILLTFACLAVVMTGIQAIRARELKWVLAYSSLGQIGYMVIGLALVNHDGLTGGIVHLFNHALIKGGLFMAAGCVVYRLGSHRIGDLAGLGKRMPLTAAAILVGGFGLIGVPLTAGFISKWYLVAGALEAGLWPVAVVLLLGSLLALVYVWRIVEQMYFLPPPATTAVAPGGREAPLSMLVCTWILIGGSIVVGIFATPVINLASHAADEALHGHAMLVTPALGQSLGEPPAEPPVAPVSVEPAP